MLSFNKNPMFCDMTSTPNLQCREISIKCAHILLLSLSSYYFKATFVIMQASMHARGYLSKQKLLT